MAKKVEDLNKDELAALAQNKGVDVDPDEQSEEEMADALKDAGVDETQDEEESQGIAEERQEDLATAEGKMAGGTPGGASESQQTQESQSAPDSTSGRERGSGPQLSDLDPETRAAVTPRPAGPRNTAMDYSDA